MDYLQILGKQLKGNIKSQNHQNYHFKEKSLRRLVVKDYNQNKLEFDDHGKQLGINVKINSQLAFSINRPDPLFQFTEPVSIDGLPYTLFTKEEYVSILHDKQLQKFWDSIISLLKSIKPDTEESVYFYKNGISLTIRSGRDILMVVDGITDLVNNNPEIFNKNVRKVVSANKIPDNLHSLIPFIKKYAISDDVERENAIDKMSKNQKAKLISTVEPLMPEINNYLDSFKDNSLSEEATMIGNLAELVSELMVKRDNQDV